jgi:RNA polymerase sigma factor (sigma-70 family)
MTTFMGSTVMTAVPSWDIVGPSGTDAELALASASGDRGAFAEIYDRYADRLHDFCCGMLRDREGAADCVQDVFCIAATRMTQLREPDKLRPWLYSIARTEALRRIRNRERETVSDELPDAESLDPGPETLAARTELADLVAEAAGGLSDRDRTVLELAYRHGLDGADLADALEVSQVNANTIVHRLRETVERALGALLVSRRVRSNPNECLELATILDGWDGEFTVLMRKRIARHIEGCETCDEERRRLVNPVALLGAAPVFIPAPAWLRDRTLGEIELVSSSSPMSNDHDGGSRNAFSAKLPAVLFAAALLATLGLAAVWLQQHNTIAVTPVDTSEAVPNPPVAPIKSNPPPPAAPAPAPSVKVKPSTAAEPPPQRTPVVQTQAPTPPTPPVVVDPAVEPPIETPVEPPPPSPPPPPPLEWPEWSFPQWPQPPPPPPGGGRLTGPPNLVVDPPVPPRQPLPQP